MVRAFRRCIAAVLAVTLCAPLLEAQALACSAMEPGADTSMAAMPGMVHDAGGSASHESTMHESDVDANASTECVLTSGCVSSSAIPAIETSRHAFHVIAPGVEGNIRSISSRALSPDLPPPRF